MNMLQSEYDERLVRAKNRSKMMIIRNSLFFVLFIMMAVVVAACTSTGGTSNPTPSALELTQTFTGQNAAGGTITVRYPEGWFQSGTVDGSLTFTNVENLMVIDGQTNPSGEIITNVLLIPAASAVAFTATGEVSASAILDNFATLFGAGDNPAELSEAQPITLNGKTGVVTTGDSPLGTLAIIVLELGNGNYALVFGTTALGEQANLRSALDAIAGSIEYTPAG
jgi:hypothetical protein